QSELQVRIRLERQEVALREHARIGHVHRGVQVLSQPVGEVATIKVPAGRRQDEEVCRVTIEVLLPLQLAPCHHHVTREGQLTDRRGVGRCREPHDCQQRCPYHPVQFHAFPPRSINKKTISARLPPCAVPDNANDTPRRLV